MSKSVSQRPPHIVWPAVRMVFTGGKMRVLSAWSDRSRKLAATGAPSGKQPPENARQTLMFQGIAPRCQRLAKHMTPHWHLGDLVGARFQGGGEGVEARRWSSLSRWVCPSLKFSH
jgi:hypothetical protein